MGLVGLVVAALVAFALLSYGIVIYNGLVVVSSNIQKAWSNIDVLLKQRYDELPKLVAACQGYMTHEKAVFDRVMKAREALMLAQGPGAKGQAEGGLQGALRQLFALAENYPDLKAQASFQQLQSRITGLESQIADRREFYNDTVNTYNIRIRTIPDLFVALLLRLKPQEMFQVAAAHREDVPVAFH